MTSEITLGAAALMGALVLATAAVRWAVSPAAARARRTPRVHGAATVQQWAYCPACAGVTPATVHGALLRCDTGHLTANPEVTAGLDRLHTAIHTQQGNQ
ncbi:hypothetical protein [Streptomyces sp. NPDC017086]|uniref:hypothetical protein n=1 Tax=Streptomyces sp. NPDC017086 TaxID=3364976 RepID=UPI0037A553AE